jgi:glycerol-3-phosphate acyltransferase PlsY
MQYLIGFFLGYVIGSFPTAYLLVQWKAKIDIRQSGTGNVGAMNTFDVTGSKMLGVAVFLIDMLKGVLAVKAASWFIGEEFWILGVCSIGVIAGHNYSPWLKFKGGRGLATGAGVFAVMGWICVVVWCGVWVLHYLLSKNIHLANVAALIISPLVLFAAPEQWLSNVLPAGIVKSEFTLLVSVLCLLMLIKHIAPLKEIWKTSTHKQHP